MRSAVARYSGYCSLAIDLTLAVIEAKTNLHSPLAARLKYATALHSNERGIPVARGADSGRGGGESSGRGRGWRGKGEVGVKGVGVGLGGGGMI